MTEKDLSDEKMRCILTPLSVLTHMGFKCITKNGEDLTDDLRKITRNDFK